MSMSCVHRSALSCPIVWNAAVGGLVQRATVGGQDKRPDARGVYGIVVVEVFVCRELGNSAALTAIPLITYTFHRAMPYFGEAPA